MKETFKIFINELKAVLGYTDDEIDIDAAFENLTILCNHATVRIKRLQEQNDNQLARINQLEEQNDNHLSQITALHEEINRLYGEIS